MTIAAGTKLGRYEIRSKIGEGGMGEVYLAEDTRLHRKVALKILPADLASNRDRMRRFEQEATAAAALNHPNIAHIYEIGEDEGTHFIAMEFIDGLTLRELIHGRQTELSKLLRYLQHAAEGLAKAHAAGIVHRDLKPDNIMITREGHAKILDFGLAKLIEQRPSATSAEGPSELVTAVMPEHSKPGTVMGTVGYMSPEQAQGHVKEIDHRSDIFSFGCILFEAATGKKPFEGESVIKSLHMVVYEPAPPLADLNPSAPPEMQRIVRRCLAKDPEERYQSIKEVTIELKELRRELGGAAAIDTTVSPSRDEATGPRSSDAATRSVSANTQVASLKSSASSAEYIVSGIKQHKIAVALVLLVLIAGGVGLSFYLHARNTEVAIESIAVLPFENQNRDASVEWLSDGVTESIINNLAQLPNLRVSPRSTVFHYKGTQVDPLAVGKELGVRAVLTGRFLQTGDDVTISVELVDVRDNKQLWGDRFRHKVADALMMQQEISQQISERLRLKLSETEQQKMMAKRNTTNAEAYQSYLKGRYFWNQRTVQGLRNGIGQFQQAIDRDPNYALAYTGLSDCYSLLEQYAGTPASEVLPKAKAAAERAVELDDSLAEAHTSLANVYMFMWQWSKSEEEFKRAISLNPNYPTAHHWYKILLRAQGRLDEALAEIKQAQQLDPLSPIIELNVSTVYLDKNDLDPALLHARRVIELNPKFPLAHDMFGRIYLKQGRYTEAVAEFEKDVVTERTSNSLSSLGYAYGVAGQREKALAILKELEQNYAKHEALGQYVAAVYVGLGDKDKAFAWLEKEFQSRGGNLPTDLVERVGFFNSLRGDPRYTDLVTRMGLKPL
jgi:eukaryotic-like serine/threonine-protein kinase